MTLKNISLLGSSFSLYFLIPFPIPFQQAKEQEPLLLSVAQEIDITLAQVNTCGRKCLFFPSGGFAEKAQDS